MKPKVATSPFRPPPFQLIRGFASGNALGHLTVKPGPVQVTPLGRLGMRANNRVPCFAVDPASDGQGFVLKDLSKIRATHLSAAAMRPTTGASLLCRFLKAAESRDKVFTLPGLTILAFHKLLRFLDGLFLVRTFDASYC
jgi:hypothetical protein